MSSVATKPISAHEATDYLRSVNLEYDITAPERISHFRPTSKSVPMIQSLVFQSSSENYLVVAPYGSGKSLLATYIGQVLENRSSGIDALRDISERLEGIAPELSEALSYRLETNQLVRPSGLALVLHGHQPNLAKALLVAITGALSRLDLEVDIPFAEDVRSDELPDVLRWLAEAKNEIRKVAARANVEVQRIVVLWDEFGRHLEELVANGEAAKLNDIQLLAETAARQRTIPVSMALFLHQSLANYAAGLSQTVRKEWKKVEGRFETIQFVDDSAEITSLIADIVASMRESIDSTVPELVDSHQLALDEVGLFRDVPSSKLPNVLGKAYPLEPSTLYLLPRVSARVAQNERTLFSFLFSVDLREPVSPAHLFDYFAESMRSDTGVGGAYHQWLETQNAIEKCSDEQSATAIKTAGLLGLGVSGQRSRVALRLLELSTAGYRTPIESASVTIRSLIDQKLLLYRKNTDQVSLWHGVDIDLRGRLEREKGRVGLTFDVVDFVKSELPPSPWLPVEYNADFAITRYFSCEFIPASRIDEEIVETERRLDDGADGIILQILPDDDENAEALLARVLSLSLPERLVFSLPRNAFAIFDAALEVHTLRRMQDDDALVGEDPLVLPELRQMTDDALEYLRRSLMRVSRPMIDGPIWIAQGSVQPVDSAVELRRLLSTICRSSFPETPRINNELIVRKKPRQVIVNSRKKLVAAILDHYGDEDFGLEGYRPDRSMLNTVLLHTGLYKNDKGTWRFVTPAEVKDAHLRQVWKRFRDLVSKPTKTPKDLEGFFRSLREPPIGLRAGLFPILFAAALRAFPSAISLTRDGAYVEDILPSTIETICAKPSEFELRVLPMTDEIATYLRRIRSSFDRTERQTSETDLVRVAFDSVQRWLTELPPAALSTRRVSRQASKLRSLLSRISDPVELFLKRLPTEFEITDLSSNKELTALRGAIEELESVVNLYYDFAESALRETLELRSEAAITSDVKAWTRLIPAQAVTKMTNALARALYPRLTMPYDSPHRLIDSVASLLIDRTVNRWDDSTLAAFDIALRSAVRQIEEYALQAAKDDPDLSVDLVKLAEVRIKNLYRYLTQITGSKEAAKILKHIASEEQSL